MAGMEVLEDKLLLLLSSLQIFLCGPPDDGDVDDNSDDAQEQFRFFSSLSSPLFQPVRSLLCPESQKFSG